MLGGVDPFTMLTFFLNTVNSLCACPREIFPLKLSSRNLACVSRSDAILTSCARIVFSLALCLVVARLSAWLCRVDGIDGLRRMVEEGERGRFEGEGLKRKKCEDSEILWIDFPADSESRRGSRAGETDEDFVEVIALLSFGKFSGS